MTNKTPLITHHKSLADFMLFRQIHNHMDYNHITLVVPLGSVSKHVLGCACAYTLYTLDVREARTGGQFIAIFT